MCAVRAHSYLKVFKNVQMFLRKALEALLNLVYIHVIFNFALLKDRMRIRNDLKCRFWKNHSGALLEWNSV
jgi:hypothetical protein